MLLARHAVYGPWLILSNEGYKSLNLYKSVCKLREVLKIDGCNLGLPKKSSDAIAPPAPF